MKEQVGLDPDSSVRGGTENYVLVGEQEGFRVHHLAQENYFGIEKFGWKSDLNPNLTTWLVSPFLSELCWLWVSKSSFSFSFFPDEQ